MAIDPDSRRTGAMDSGGGRQIRQARTGLDRIREARRVARALAQGAQAADVAAALGLPRQTVERIARRVRAGFDAEFVSPAEIIDLNVVGEISDDEMMRRLGEQTFTFGQYDPTGGDGYRRGTWDEVQSAVGRGLLTGEQYGWLLDRIGNQTGSV